MKICVTGSLGFVGSSLIEQLLTNSYNVIAPIRKFNSLINTSNENLKFTEIGNIDAKSNWSKSLYGVDCIIHCAARSHIMKETKKDPLNIYRKINVDGTCNLAEQAAEIGVKRLIYLSSIKVNGEQTFGSSSFKYNDIPKPEDAYGISKWEAEQNLWEISQKTGLEVVIIRPPLVYGKKVKGNFLRLLNLVYKGIPLPFGKVKNYRSLLGLDNLIDLIICCIRHPKAAGQTFLISDGEDISTPELIKKLSYSLRKTSRLVPFPVSLIKFMGIIIGKSLETNRLLGSLKIDSSYTCDLLKWRPVISTNDALHKTAQWYLDNQ